MLWGIKAFSVTIWHRNAVSASDWRFRGIFRFVLPLTDLFFLWFGIVGWYNGVQSVQEANGDGWQEWWSLGIAVSAAGALVGVSFPRLWGVELLAKINLVGLVSGYVALMLARGLHEPNVTAVAGLIVILILLPIWRVSDLGKIASRWWQARKDRNE
jgi:hypothetical protein